MSNFQTYLLCVGLLAATATNAIALTADAFTAEEIIKKSEDIFVEGDAKMEFSMHILNPDFERTLKMVVWSRGRDKSFMLTKSPAKEKGNTFLKTGNNMYSYIKSVDEEMKIMPTMMFQGMMGSEFTYDDMMRESTYTEDYTAKIAEETDEYWELKLTPKKGSGITYTYLKYRVDKENYTPRQVRYYSKKGLQRYINYSGVKEMGGRTIPTVWKMINHKKEGRVTTVTVTSAEFDMEIPDSTFTKSNLRRAR